MTDKPRILIIEDEPALLLMMVYLLTRVGCDVLTAWSGEKGIQMAKEGKFDLITLDIDLPDISGFEICRGLNQNPALSHLPIIFISGRILEEDRQRAFEVGAADYIEKPFDVSFFVQRILFHAKSGKRQVLGIKAKS